MNVTWKSPSFLLALGLHILLISLLLFTFEKTIRIPAHMPDLNKPIIDAVMINNDVVKKEVERLDQIEKDKVEKEKARQREIVRKEKEAVEKRQKEEALALELKKKNEQLKKEAEAQRVAKIKQQKEEKIEKERLAKEKKQQEADLKKLQKQKEAALAEQKKLDDSKKAAEEAARQQANIKVKMDLLTQHAMLIRNKINRNWRQPQGLDFTGLKCEVLVKLLPTGEVSQVQIIKQSGSMEFDRSAEIAIGKASPLPMPDDQELAKEFRQFTFTFNPGVA